MPQEIVPIDRSRPIRRAVGSTVTFVNQSAVDVYFDYNPNRLNAALAGVVPDGTKLIAAGGQVQWSQYPGVIFVRAVTLTFLEVQP
jgi:hypothetical protein